MDLLQKTLVDFGQFGLLLESSHVMTCAPERDRQGLYARRLLVQRTTVSTPYDEARRSALRCRTDPRR